MLRLIAVDSKSGSFLFTFYWSVIYLPAYTMFPEILLKWDDTVVDGFLEYINHSQHKPLQFNGLHEFHPK